jgi:predicted permease
MRSTIRSLRRKPVFAVAAIGTVALGIGANTALFGVIYAVLIRPLPFRDPAKLVEIWETQLQVTVPDWRDWQTQARSFEQIAAYTLAAMNNTTLLGQGEPAAVHATMASSNFFPTMGIEPLAGRAFSDEEERTKQRVVLLSENLWRHKFGADPSIAGRQIRLETESFRVLGVVPQRQAFPEWADLWMPISLIEPEMQTRRKYHPLEIIARLRPGATAEQAQFEMQTIARRLAESYPETNAREGASVIPLARAVTGAVRPSLLLAWAAVGLVLLIACANLAHLFLARWIERRQEIAIREALGAGPWRLMRQLLSESLLIAAAGGAAGLAVALFAGQFARKMAAGQIPRADWTPFDGPVWLFAAAISVGAGVLFGLPACWQTMRRRRSLAATGRTIARGQSRLNAVLLAGEVAMALLVLSGAALLTRSFAALLNEDPGFQPAHVVAIPNLPLRSDWDKAEAFLNTRLAAALGNVPGVVEVAASNSAPMTLGLTEHSRFATRFGVEGRTYHNGSYPVAQNRWGTADYFRVLGIPLRAGRWLSESQSDKDRLMINETLARRFFPGQDPVGRRLTLSVLDPHPEQHEIVGVVGDVRDFGLDQEAQPTLYGISTGPVMTLLVKTAPGAQVPAAALRDAIHSADPEIPVSRVQPLEQNIADSLARRRFVLSLLVTFAAMAAFLTAGGIYGLLAQSATQRVREFGVRAAVGAAPGDLVRMILREAVLLTAPGLIVGAVLAMSFAKVMKSAVYQLSPTDPVSIASAAAFLVVLTFVSAWLPARRAAAVDPAVALRTE